MDHSQGLPANLGIYSASAPFYDLHTPTDVSEILGFCDFAIQRHARRPIRDLIEFACGTGRILLPLAARGYQAVRTDLSEAMLGLCRDRATKEGLAVKLRCELMQDFAEVERYDAMLAVFGAIAFLVDDEPIRKFFAACYRGLRPGGILLVDMPNGLHGLVEPWAKTTTDVNEKEGVGLERFVQQIPDTLRGTSRYRITGIFRTPSGEGFYQEEFLLRIFSLPLLRLLLEPTPFKQLTCYCNWNDREPMCRPHSRLILVLEK